MSPQHLQQQDAFHEALLATRFDALSPWSWGVVSVEISERALSAGQLEVQEFQGVLPGGLPLAFEAGQPEAPAARPVGAHFGATQRELEVFLGVPREREGVPNCVPPENGTRVRFAPVARQVVDSTAAASDTQVTFAQPTVSVLFGDEPREDFEVIKIAELLRDKTGALILRDSFIPAALRIGASPFLMAGLRRLLAMLTSKWRQAREQTRQRDASTVEFGASDVTQYLLLSTISGFLPVLRHLADSPDLPPHVAFVELERFAGQLATFTADVDPTTLPAFTYTNLGATFEELLARVIGLVQARVRQDYLSVPLDPRDDGVHSTKLEDERLLGCQTFLLAARAADISEQQVADQLPKLSKIASWNDIASLIAAAMPGVAAKATTRPPSEIPVRAGVVYFNLATRDVYWRNVLSERTLAVYLPPPFDPQKVRLELLAVPSRAEAVR